MRWRSVLFTPATKPDRAGRLAEAAADVTVLDLEDAVAVGEKDGARRQLAGFAAALRAAAPDLVVLARVNPRGTPWFADDVAAAADAGVAGVVVPKVVGADDADAVFDLWGGDGRPAPLLLAGLETAAGVEAAPATLGGGAFAAAYFGAEDYIADVGGRRRPSSVEVLYARSRVVMAAAIGGVDAVDQVVVRYRDAEAFDADATLARDLGYRGKLCIHPGQVVLANAAFTPDPEEVARARAILDALAAAGGGVASHDGQMIDAPAVAAAEAVVARAGL